MWLAAIATGPTQGSSASTQTTRSTMVASSGAVNALMMDSRRADTCAGASVLTTVDSRPRPAWAGSDSRLGNTGAFGLTLPGSAQDRQDVVAIALELAGTDPRDHGQLARAGRTLLGDRGQGGICE